MEILLSNPKKQDTCIASKVFEKARHLFNTVGVRNTTMDDLAKELGISKKTLYKEVENKADLVKFCVQYDLNQDEKLINSISENTENAIEELVLIAAHISKELQIYHPSILKDITKLYPESWTLIENHKDTFVKKNISDNIKKGIKQGLYRKDVNAELATIIQLHLCFLPLENIYNNYNPTQVYQEILRYNLYAIATPKGIELFEQLIKKIKL
ncbi:MAG TPA: TetR/AcrR family transcriptional regulator [Chitinophagales bacterium]|nr:TetR/AcrR family transcriptional regulator [Chitinophagales bacterium]